MAWLPDISPQDLLHFNLFQRGFHYFLNKPCDFFVCHINTAHMLNLSSHKIGCDLNVSRQTLHSKYSPHGQIVRNDEISNESHNLLLSLSIKLMIPRINFVFISSNQFVHFIPSLLSLFLLLVLSWSVWVRRVYNYWN